MKDVWLELANQLEVVPGLTIANIDAVHNEIPDLDIIGYPTILLFSAPDKYQPLEYEGERTIPAFTAFLKEYSPAYQKYVSTQKKGKGSRIWMF